MSGLRNRLLRKFRSRDYRHSYVESFLNSLISEQIRALREREEWSQKELAERTDTTQSGVSRYERPDYSSWRIETLRKLARAFDMVLSVKFVSFGDALDDIDALGSEKLMRPSFADDPVFHGNPVVNFPGPKFGRGESATWTSVGENGLEAQHG